MSGPREGNVGEFINSKTNRNLEFKARVHLNKQFKNLHQKKHESGEPNLKWIITQMDHKIIRELQAVKPNGETYGDKLVTALNKTLFKVDTQTKGEEEGGEIGDDEKQLNSYIKYFMNDDDKVTEDMHTKIIELLKKIKAKS